MYVPEIDHRGPLIIGEIERILRRDMTDATLQNTHHRRFMKTTFATERGRLSGMTSILGIHEGLHWKIMWMQIDIQGVDILVMNRKFILHLHIGPTLECNYRQLER
jgi:hypothetical protein